MGGAGGNAETGALPLPDILRPAVLPTRNRGTRECSRCSKFLTLARISDTICTPLLFDVVPKTGAVTSVGLRGRAARGVLLLVGSRDGENVASVCERTIPVAVLALFGGVPAQPGGRPTRLSSAVWLSESTDEDE